MITRIFKNIAPNQSLFRESRRYSTDIEEAHSLVDNRVVDEEVVVKKNHDLLEEQANKSRLSKMYILSALLDISGYVIRSIGYFDNQIHNFRVEWCIVEVVFSKLPSALLPSSVLFIPALS